MKNLVNFSIIVSAIFVILLSCNKNDTENSDENNNNDTIGPLVLQHRYLGQLHLYFSNEFPEFESTGSVDVEVDRDGSMEFSSGGLQYLGEDDNGQAKIKREGEIIMMPNGNYFMQDDDIYFAVDENSMLTETMTVWYWNDNTQQWVQAFSQPISETWNGGLNFSLIDAEINGSIIEASSEMGTVRWTLTLSPDIN